MNTLYEVFFFVLLSST